MVRRKTSGLRAAWELLQDAEKLQSEMTAEVQAKLEKSI